MSPAKLADSIFSIINALVYILSCLAAYTLAQPKVKIGNIGIPNTMPSATTSS